jgi:nitrogen fixation NifU-like protein
MSLRDLYQEIIIDHGKKPRNFGQLQEANHCQVGHNPLCGDKLVVYVLEKNNVIEDLQFVGEGCAISVASASLMTEAVKGKTRQEMETLFSGFYHLVTEGKEIEENLGKLAVFSGVAEFPVRVKCATLAWHTLKAALNNQTDAVSTE